MKKNISKKQKISIIAISVLVLIGGIIWFSSTTLADPPTPPQNVRYFNGNVNVSLNATDDNTGVNYTIIETWYRLNSQSIWTNILPATNYTDTITYSTQGQYQIHYYSVDNCGNEETEKHTTFVIYQDTTAPVTTITLDGNEIIPT